MAIFKINIECNSDNKINIECNSDDKINIECNSDEGVLYWDIQSKNDCNHDNSRDAIHAQKIQMIIDQAIKDIDNFLLGSLSCDIKKGDYL